MALTVYSADAQVVGHGLHSLKCRDACLRGCRRAGGRVLRVTGCTTASDTSSGWAWPKSSSTRSTCRGGDDGDVGPSSSG